jgi:DNA-binding response OmpR family regulator
MSEASFRILIVDDDTDFCELLKQVLCAEGYEVHLAYDIPEAMTLLMAIKPNLILTDMMLPEVDGLTFIRALRRYDRWAEVPALVVSAQPAARGRCEAEQAGADEFLSKPFDLQDLKMRLRMHLPCTSC